MMRGFSLASPVDHHGYKIVLKRAGRKPEPGCAASGEALKKEKQKKKHVFQKTLLRPTASGSNYPSNGTRA
ncbi:hypothetical protein AA0311_0692 [Asaia bogorensis NBRC 16594]|uniref:Uncharacterized protein n=1 Tax=Asaia bogorensis NBRC 16594 TaxID=1231624 RepID=A0AAN4R561_9PROT|nr:hypothetical protein Asbog_00167 [Asaia bogorensis NBRC 16594]GBQ74928.1 hypothetical protein AA0311_0692 [Asaia bogorensis NBRC 16594]GEL52834.1 hypothetical protein ABO01nite_08410 [Asaia bogorensis NBRC 16594]